MPIKRRALITAPSLISPSQSRLTGGNHYRIESSITDSHFILNESILSSACPAIEQGVISETAKLHTISAVSFCTSVPGQAAIDLYNYHIWREPDCQVQNPSSKIRHKQIFARATRRYPQDSSSNIDQSVKRYNDQNPPHPEQLRYAPA
jgi:hypothetical protein